MTYEEAVEWVLTKLPMFQQTGVNAYKKDLTNIKKLIEQIGDFHHQFKSIHVAGTNGKGSTCHMLASVLWESNYKTGLFTSPHLKDFRERIRVNGKMCSKDFVLEFVERNAEIIENLEVSFFEVSVVMAFEYFAKEQVDFAVIETGLGGRLDSTNIITPVLSVITNIGLDHTHILGDSLERIAFEKAGIIKPKIPVIIGETTVETKPVFVEKAKEMGSEIFFAEEKVFPDYASDLTGVYQKKNRKTVLTALEELNKIGVEIPDSAIEAGLKHVMKNTGLHGRWEILQKEPMIVADTAHNPHGLAEIKIQFANTTFQKLHLVLGFVNDKDVKSILDFFPKDACYYFCSPNVPRRLPINELMRIIPKELNSAYFDTVFKALNAAKINAAKEDLIYVGGSTFVVAEVI